MLVQILYHIKLQVIPIHKMFNALGEDRSKGLLMFHSLTGCDTTTGILGITKHTAFQKWLDIVVKDSYILAPMNTMTCHDLSAINFDYYTINKKKLLNGLSAEYTVQIATPWTIQGCNCFFTKV